jgi:hypothetical protein
MHQVVRFCRRSDPTIDALICSTGVMHLVHETFADDITHAGCDRSLILHISDAVNQTLRHLHTCHPNPARLIQLSKITKGMPLIAHPQQIETCSDCLVAKTCKVARGYEPAFEATHIGQGLTLDIGFMFQRSKNKTHADLLIGINGCNAYCIVYNFLTEVIFGITLIGKLTPITWLNVLLTWIAPPISITRHIVRMDLGGETGLNPDITALLIHHGYATQSRGAGASNQNPMAYLSHQTIANAIRAMLFGATPPPQYWEYAFYFCLWIHTVLPHGKNTVLPYHLVTHCPADLTPSA